MRALVLLSVRLRLSSEGDGKYEIDADKCIDCGTCADTCPVGAPAQE